MDRASSTRRPCLPSGCGLVSTARLLPMTLMVLAAVVLGHSVSGGHDHQRLWQIGLLACGVLVVAAKGRALAFRPVAGGAISVLLTAFFTLGMISALLSLSPVLALREVLLLGLLWVAALCIAREMSEDHGARLSIVLGVLGAGAAVYLFELGVIWLSAVLTQIQPDVYLFAPGFSNYRFFNHGQTISLPLFVLAACRSRPAHRSAWLVLATCWACMLLALGARGSMLGLLAGGIAVLALQRGQALRFLMTFAFVCAAGLLLFFILGVWIPRAVGLAPFGDLLNVVSRSTGQVASSFRDILWLRALSYVAACPWLGIGPAHYGRYAADLDIGSHPHDAPLQIAAEWGVPALLLLLAALGIAGRRLLRAGRQLSPGDKPNQLIYSALLFTGVAIAVDGLVSGLIVMPVSQLMIALYLGCAIGWVRSLTAPGAVGPDPGARLAFRVAMPAAVLALLLSAAYDFPEGPGGKAAGGRDIHPAETYPHPRFWLHETFTQAELRALECGPGQRPSCP